MRKFYIFECDPSLRGYQRLEGHELASFDYFLLRRGERIETIPSGLRLYVLDKKRIHLLGNPFGWKIMSETAVAIVREFIPDAAIQLISIPILNVKTNKPITGFQLVNCLRVIPALASPHTDDILGMDQVVIKESLVPPETHLFLLGEYPRHWVVSEHLWQRLSTLVGFDAIPTAMVE